ncbi:cytochrome c biogenesis protein CcsA [Paraliomyxa miuraensis]|uniref:cytochrome c biogenesis protein CcsA n=1 Tax=Paraliomyxa miuraensis TaxID=376150 RepID=UPI0022573A06|nr:cytochrome c biogenesis protein CcsA [Paraliomyxa miuraensis]MCX4239844.1 cytochrome c biogenesis protein [Paraliomyxa miuraensis]
MGRLIPVVLLAIAAVVFPLSVETIFLDVGIERQLGTVQKIFYFHVPLAWIMMLYGVVCGIAAAVQLRRQSRGAEAIAIAAGEMVIVAGLGVLITGPIWGHASWGKAWTWDARQISTGLLWLVFVAYVLVRRYGAAGSERLAAALAIFGAVDVPIIYYAVKIWKTTHPSNEVVVSLPPEMWAALWPALGALLATATALVAIRARQELCEMELDDAWVRAEDPSVGTKGETT